MGGFLFSIGSPFPFLFSGIAIIAALVIIFKKFLLTAPLQNEMSGVQ